MAKARAQKTLTVTVTVRVLGIDASFEPDTQALCDYRNRNVYPHFEKKGFVVDRCQGPLADRSHVSAKAQQSGVVYITGSGHGDASTFKGYLYNPVFHSGDYSPVEVTGKIIHLQACHTARDLGRDLGANGCLAFFGYSDEFLWPPALPDFFFECDNEIDRAFADGLTAAKVYTRVTALFQKRAADLRALGKQTEAATLESDFDVLCCPSFPPPPNDYGNEAAKLP
jgi:hypothetical protein